MTRGNSLIKGRTEGLPGGASSQNVRWLGCDGDDDRYGFHVCQTG